MKSIGQVISEMKPPNQTPPSETNLDDDPYAKEMRRKHVAEVRAKFTRICPTLYQQTDMEKLNQDRLYQVLSWEYGPKGLLLVGPTGRGKTRCAWLLIRRLILEDCHEVTYFDGIGWGISVSKAYGDPESTESWLNRLCRVDVLFFDDLFKAKMTEAQEQALYGVFERRSASLKPIIATMNSTGDMILSRMTESGRADRGEPLLRRMREFCEVIQF